MKRRLLLVPFALFAALSDTLAVAQSEPLLAERDRAKLTELFADFFAAKAAEDYRALSKANDALNKELDARAKRAKVDNLLVSPADMRAVFGGPINPEKTPRKGGAFREVVSSERTQSGPFEYKYLLRLPKGYRHELPNPVIIFMHANGLDAKGLEAAIAKAYPEELLDQAIVIAPNRLGLGDDAMSLEQRLATFSALINVSTRYAVDRLRVYIDGSKEGALAAITYAMHYPGFFCGVILRELSRAPEPTLLANAQHVPVLLLAPMEGDLADVMAQFADTAKANQVAGVTLVPTELGADGSPGAAGAAALVSFVTETRKRVAPEKVRYTSTSIESANAYWLHLIDFKATPEAPITVHAAIDRATNEISVETPAAVSAFVIYVNDAIVDMGKTVKVTHRVRAEKTTTSDDVVPGEGEGDGAPRTVFEGTVARSLERALTLWRTGSPGNLGEVYCNWIEVRLPQQ